MPHAFAIANGLDWETEVRSFWAWLDDSKDVLEADGEVNSLVRELVESQKDRIEEYAGRQKDQDSARCTLTIAMALVGFHYSSTQKLINGLREAGLFAPPRERPTFDTIR